MSRDTTIAAAVGTHTRTSAGAAPLGREDWGRLVGRVLLGGIFVVSGYGKVFGVAAFAASLERRGVPFASTLSVIGACVEFFGGLAVVLGLEVRYVAVLMIAFVIVATGISHRFWEFAGADRAAQVTNFSKNVAIIGGFVLLAAAGGGRLALERIWRRD